MNVSQVTQIVGALLIVTGFILSQRDRLDPRSYTYLLLNLIGGAILTALAFQDRSWGFVLLEGAWSLIALVGLVMKVLGKEPATTH